MVMYTCLCEYLYTCALVTTSNDLHVFFLNCELRNYIVLIDLINWIKRFLSGDIQGIIFDPYRRGTDNVTATGSHYCYMYNNTCIRISNV